jgi:hypothetical protein
VRWMTGQAVSAEPYRHVLVASPHSDAGTEGKLVRAGRERVCSAESSAQRLHAHHLDIAAHVDVETQMGRRFIMP